jgi:hypothetical protein
VDTKERKEKREGGIARNERKGAEKVNAMGVGVRVGDGPCTMLGEESELGSHSQTDTEDEQHVLRYSFS